MPKANERRSETSLGAADRDAAARLVSSRGLTAAADLLGVHRESLARALAPVGGVRRGTVSLIRAGLARLASEGGPRHVA